MDKIHKPCPIGNSNLRKWNTKEAQLASLESARRERESSLDEIDWITSFFNSSLLPPAQSLIVFKSSARNEEWLRVRRGKIRQSHHFQSLSVYEELQASTVSFIVSARNGGRNENRIFVPLYAVGVSRLKISQDRNNGESGWVHLANSMMPF